jgi:predicted RNase H-like HicB family nuclease/DNA-binding XRE family transcriptional regulator
MVYHFRVHREDNGYWAECIELAGCVTDADSLDELKANAEEALNLYLDEQETSSVIFPLPESHTGPDIIDVPVDPGIALSVVLRRYREEHRYTQSEVAEKLGMKNMYSYQRLERHSNPSLSTLRKLKDVFPDLSVDYILQ